MRERPGRGGGWGACGDGCAANRLVLLNSKVTVVVGEVEIDPEFAGLAPGTAGLYQVSVPLPAETPAGSAVPLYLKRRYRMGGIVKSNTVNVAVADAIKGVSY